MKRINITCMDNVIWYGLFFTQWSPSCAPAWSPSCANMSPRSVTASSVVHHRCFILLLLLLATKRNFTWRLMTRRSCKNNNNHMAPAGCFTKHDHLIHHRYITDMTISHHMPCKNKLDASNLSLHVLRGFGFSREPFLYLRITTTTTWMSKVLIKPTAFRCSKLCQL
jgi:hypothetical protein